MPCESPDIIIVTDQEAGQRLDCILASRFAGMYSRTYFQKLLEDGKILLNGCLAKKRTQPQSGDEIEIQFVLSPEITLLPEEIPLDIIYEDDDILAVNKPSGLVIHPAVGNWSGTFVNALLFYCKQLIPIEGDSQLRPGIVHRLDKDTSGVLIAAKNLLSQQRLIEMFAARRIHKEYLAIVVGNPGDVECNFPIGRDPIHRQRMAVNPKGKPAVTICRTLKTNGQFSLIHLTIATGRTHQIRVHLKHKNAPVLGDSLYGNIDINRRHKVERQLLHASTLSFAHPLTGKRLELTAPVPADMQTWISKLTFL